MATPEAALAPAARVVVEDLDPGDVPLYRHPEWRQRFPWLVQGTTGRGDGTPYDLGAFGQGAISDVLDRWRALREATGTISVVHSRQVHGTDIGEWSIPLPRGLYLTEGLDAHTTANVGLLLAVSIADCVPAFLIDSESRSIAMVHAGWRGVAGGALERAVSSLVEGGSDPGDLLVHFGPSMCAKCYEVGPEVHVAVHPHRDPPRSPTPIDLRSALAERAISMGVHAENVTISGHCTSCGPGRFFSHRGGDAARQMGVLGRLE